MCVALRLGYKVGILSGGFTYFAKKLQELVSVPFVAFYIIHTCFFGCERDRETDRDVRKKMSLAKKVQELLSLYTYMRVCMYHIC